MIPARVQLAMSVALAVAHHASPEKPLSCVALEAYYRLPPRKLEPVVRKLVKAGIIQTIRGAQGGLFVPDAERVRLSDIVRAVLEKSKPLRLMPPLDELVQHTLASAHGALMISLQHISLADLLAEAEGKRIFSLKTQALEYAI